MDLSAPTAEVWEYLKPYIEEYDAVVLSRLPEYAQSDRPAAGLHHAGEGGGGRGEGGERGGGGEDSALVNVLQRHAAVVMKSSLREGFGLTATEAMWKRAAVVAGRCGGLTRQIDDGVNGFLVDSVEDAAERLVRLLTNPDLRQRLGAKAREVVRERFLLTRKLEQYLDLFSAFEPQFAVDYRRLSALNHLSQDTPSS